MSKFEQMETKLTEGQYLVEALETIGYKPVVDWNGQTLRGYGGAIWPERAQVVIPRAQLKGALADIGFVRDASGVFRAVIDDMDRDYSGFDVAWLGRLTQTYKEKQTMAVARAKGYVFKGREVIDTPQGKKVQLRFAVR